MISSFKFMAPSMGFQANHQKIKVHELRRLDIMKTCKKNHVLLKLFFLKKSTIDINRTLNSAAAAGQQSTKSIIWAANEVWLAMAWLGLQDRAHRVECHPLVKLTKTFRKTLLPSVSTKELTNVQLQKLNLQAKVSDAILTYKKVGALREDSR